MKRVLVPTFGPSDWRRFLADPDNQWERKASALELAVSWEIAERSERGLPAQVAEAIDREPSFSGAKVLIALPEHKVRLKGRGRPSQSDVWVLLHSPSGYISMAVEGKAGEPFASTLAEWLKDASDGKRERLRFLCETLQIGDNPPPGLRYQLFHRTCSAILEAERFDAPVAVMMVQSFRKDDAAWDDFAAFASHLGASAARGSLSKARRSGPVALFLGWADCTPASDGEIASAV
jgi:hypothetical protein